MQRCSCNMISSLGKYHNYYYYYYYYFILCRENHNRNNFIQNSEYLQMDIEIKQIVLYVQKCILTPKELA